MKNLKQLFNETFVMSELMANKDKIETEDIINDYPEGITITDFEKVEMDNGEKQDEFYVFLFKENKEVFAFGGFMINKFFDSMCEEYGGEEKANEILKEYGGIKIVFESSKTKKNQPITTITLA